MAKKFLNWDNLEYIVEQMQKFLIDHNGLDNHLDVFWEARERVTDKMKYGRGIDGCPYTSEQYESLNTGEKYEGTFVGVYNKNAEQDGILVVHEARLNDHEERLDIQEDRLNDHERTLEAHGATLSEHSGKFAKYDEDIADCVSDIAECNEGLKNRYTKGETNTLVSELEARLLGDDRDQIEDTYETMKGIAGWIEKHGQTATDLIAGVSQNRTDIDTIQGILAGIENVTDAALINRKLNDLKSILSEMADIDWNREIWGGGQSAETSTNAPSEDPSEDPTTAPSEPPTEPPTTPPSEPPTTPPSTAPSEPPTKEKIVPIVTTDVTPNSITFNMEFDDRVDYYEIFVGDDIKEQTQYNSHVIDGLTPATTYRVQVHAIPGNPEVHEEGIWESIVTTLMDTDSSGDPTEEATGDPTEETTKAPAEDTTEAPSKEKLVPNVTTFAMSNSISLNIGSDDRIDYYNIIVGDLSAQTRNTLYVINGLTPSTTYNIQVQAIPTDTDLYEMGVWEGTVTTQMEINLPDAPVKETTKSPTEETTTTTTTLSIPSLDPGVLTSGGWIPAGSEEIELPANGGRSIDDPHDTLEEALESYLN